jgi:hypothetical protein
MLLFFNLSMRSLAYVAAACDALALVSAAWVFGDRVLALVSDALVSTALVSDDLVSTALVSACDDVERPCSQSSARSGGLSGSLAGRAGWLACWANDDENAFAEHALVPASSARCD